MLKKLWGGPNISQTALSDQIVLYLKKQGRSTKLERGYCHGFAILWGYFCLLKKEKMFFDLLKKIATWDTKKDIHLDFEKLFNHITWLHNTAGLTRLAQSEVEESLKYITEGALKSSPIQREFELSFSFTVDELATVFSKILHEDKLVLLSSYNHSVALIYSLKKFHFYDSNNSSGVKIFSHLKEFIGGSLGLIESFIFEDLRLEKKRLIGDNAYLPLSITIFDLSGKPFGKYPDAGDLINELIAERAKKSIPTAIDIQGIHGETALWMATRENHLKSFHALLKAGANVNLEDKTEHSPLLLAAKISLEMVQELIKNGALLDLSNITELENQAGYASDPNILTYLRFEKCRQALLTSDYPEFRMGLSQSIINFQSDTGDTLLHLASRGRDVNILAAMFKNFVVTMNIKDNAGLTALDIANDVGDSAIIEFLKIQFFHQAIMEGQLEKVQEMLHHDPKLLNAIDAKGYAPIHTALLTNQIDIFRLLQSAGASLKATSENYNLSILHFAAKQGHTNIVQELLDPPFSFDPNILDNFGKSPLHYAASNGHIDTINLLLSYKNTNSFIQDFDHQDPFSNAAKSNQVAAMKILLKQLETESPELVSSVIKNALQVALKEASIDALHYLFSLDSIKSIDLNALNTDGETFASVMRQRPNLEVIKLLHLHGADFSIANTNGDTVLHSIFPYASLEILTYLVQEFPKTLHMANHYGKTPLHLAIERRNEEAVLLFLHNGANAINTAGTKGNTMVHDAARSGNRMIMEALIKKGADLNIKNDEGKMPFEYEKGEKSYLLTQAFIRAVKAGDLTMVEHLAQSPHFKRIDLEEMHQGEGILSMAITRQNPAMIDYLLKECALDVNYRNSDNQTPLHYAVREGDLSTVSKLLAKGADVHAQSDFGMMPLHIAASSTHSQDIHKLIQNLIQAGANINAQTTHLFTPLHVAIISDNAQATKALLELGASITLEDKDGKTIFDHLKSGSPLENLVIPYANNAAWKTNLSLFNHCCNELKSIAEDKRLARLQAQIASISKCTPTIDYQSHLIETLAEFNAHLPKNDPVFATKSSANDSLFAESMFSKKAKNSTTHIRESVDKLIEHMLHSIAKKKSASSKG